MSWLEAGKKAAVATVIKKQGSALRSVGSKMGISSEMNVADSVSGGCVEGAVVQEALKVMKTGQKIIVDYGITDNEAWAVGLACGGQIKILIQPVGANNSDGFSLEMVRKIDELKTADIPFCVLTDISKNFKKEAAIVTEGKPILPTKKPRWIDFALLEELKSFERKETSGIITIKSREIFADFSFPKPRLVIIGAVHIAQSLVKMARICGFTTIIVDPRKTFASSERFQDVDRMEIAWPTDGLVKIGLNERDYLLALSHDEKLDLPALQMGMDKKVRYIGLLSSRKTRDNRLKKLSDAGWSKGDLRRIHAPVGLDLGARSPEEIALSILAEMIAIRYGKYD